MTTNFNGLTPAFILLFLELIILEKRGTIDNQFGYLNHEF